MKSYHKKLLNKKSIIEKAIENENRVDYLLKVLNLYSGIGGNRKLWPSNIEVTAIENNKEIAAIYQNFFPNDKVIVTDAHKYLLKHYKEFDFIWSSPPCPSHSRLNTFLNAKGIVRYPDMKLWQEIIFLNQFCKTKFVVENVISYYEPLIKPVLLGRHYFWSNFPLIPDSEYNIAINVLGVGHNFNKTTKTRDQEKLLANYIGFNLSKYKIKNKVLLLRNCVFPPLGKYVFDCAFTMKQTTLSEAK